MPENALHMHDAPILVLDSDGQVRNKATGQLMDAVKLYGQPPASFPQESPVTTVTRWRDWRFSTDR